MAKICTKLPVNKTIHSLVITDCNGTNLRPLILRCRCLSASSGHQLQRRRLATGSVLRHDSVSDGTLTSSTTVTSLMQIWTSKDGVTWVDEDPGARWTSAESMEDFEVVGMSLARRFTWPSRLNITSVITRQLTNRAFTRDDRYDDRYALAALFYSPVDSPMHQTCIRVMHVWCIGVINRWIKQRSHTGRHTRLRNTVYVFGHAHLHVYDAVSAACRWKRSTRSNIYN